MQMQHTKNLNPKRFELGTTLSQLIRSIATRKSYNSTKHRFINFCYQLGKIHLSGSPCPVEEWTLCLFATFLANSMHHSSIKVYLSAVRALHIEQGFDDPLTNCLQLQSVLCGIKRNSARPQQWSASPRLVKNGFGLVKFQNNQPRASGPLLRSSTVSLYATKHTL